MTVIARPRTVEVEEGNSATSAGTAQLLQVKNLQELRKMLLDSEVAVLQGILEGMITALERARSDYATVCRDVNARRDGEIKMLKSKPIRSGQIARWRSEELGMVARIEQQARLVRTKQMNVDEASARLLELRMRRRLTALREEKYLALIDRDDSAGL